MPKSITIHNMDSNLSEALQEKASEYGLSMNKTIKKLLSLSLGVHKDSYEARLKELEKFNGVWTQEEFEEFEKNTKVFEKIDEEIWQ